MVRLRDSWPFSLSQPQPSGIPADPFSRIRMTAQAGFYEPGAFDVRGPRPRRTLIGAAAESLARTGSFTHPVLDQEGWWRRHDRFYHPPRRTAVSKAPRRPLL